MKNTIIVSAFPGSGKTYTYEKYDGKDINHNIWKILDLDIDEFLYTKNDYRDYITDTKKLNPVFPSNMVEYIIKNLGKVDIIFIPYNEELILKLKSISIQVYVVIPGINMREEYIIKLKEKYNDDFIESISDNWYRNICKMTDFCEKHRCKIKVLSKVY